MKWLTILISVIYFLLPNDLIPEFALGWGWLDDIIIIYLIWNFYRRLRAAGSPNYGPDPDDFRRQSSPGEENRGQGQRSQANGPGGTGPWDPYGVLGLQPGASPDEIKRAYRKLALQYHPDKVAHLGQEFQALAQKRFQEIQRAYQELIHP
ncbi:MAG: DnaJ domain-containing protein [Desulfobacterales bacterium]